jgi:hypothetical protein
MNCPERFCERTDRDWKEHWWFPAGVGSLVFGIAIAIGMNSPPHTPTPFDAALCTFGLTVGMLDGFGSGRVIRYGTIRGPEERGEEANARFYAWDRASRRYATAIVFSLLSAMGVAAFRDGDLNFFAFMSGLVLYMPVWAFDLYRSLKEAKKAFPPPDRRSCD